MCVSTLLATGESNPKGQCQKTPARLVLLLTEEKPCFSPPQHFSFSAERLNTGRGQTQHYFRKWLVFKPNPLNMSLIEATKTSFPKRSSELCCSLGEKKSLTHLVFPAEFSAAVSMDSDRKNNNNNFVYKYMYLGE